MGTLKKKYIVLLVLVILIASFFLSGVHENLTLESLKENRLKLLSLYKENSVQFTLGFAALNILLIVFSIPGATLLTLAAGSFFGVIYGSVIIVISGALASLILFLSARYFFRETIERKFKYWLNKLNKGLEKEGLFYLFALRLLPLFPFFIVDLAMGLTSFSAITFFLVTLFGMIPATIVYVNAGTQLAQIQSLKEIFTLKMIISFALLGIVPLLSNWFMGYIRTYRSTKASQLAIGIKQYTS